MKLAEHQISLNFLLWLQIANLRLPWRCCAGRTLTSWSSPRMTPFSLTWWSWPTASSSSCSERGQPVVTSSCRFCCWTFLKGKMLHYDPQFTSYPPVEQVWERRDVISECQELHSLLPNSWGAECHHPDELLWGDYCQSLGEYIQMVFTCSQLDNLVGVTVVHPSVEILCEVDFGSLTVQFSNCIRFMSSASFFAWVSHFWEIFVWNVFIFIQLWVKLIGKSWQIDDLLVLKTSIMVTAAV